MFLFQLLEGRLHCAFIYIVGHDEALDKVHLVESCKRQYGLLESIKGSNRLCCPREGKILPNLFAIFMKRVAVCGAG